MKDNKKLPEIRTLSKEYMNSGLHIFLIKKDLNWVYQIANCLNVQESLLIL